MSKERISAIAGNRRAVLVEGYAKGPSKADDERHSQTLQRRGPPIYGDRCRVVAFFKTVRA